MFNKLWAKKALILFLVLLVALLPQSVSRPAQMLSKAVLTEITIDKVDGEYVLTGEMIKNLPGGGPAGLATIETEPVSGIGTSVAAAINKISAEMGRDVSFAHCKLMIMGEGLRFENLADILQYFLHRTEINNNCAVAWVEKGRTTTLEQFYKDYMRHTAASVLTHGPVDTAIFKSGRYAFTLDETQTDALGFLQSKRTSKRITHQTDILHVTHNKANIETALKNGVPTVTVTLRTRMILESNPMADAASLAQIERALESKLSGDINATLALLCQHRADILALHDRFYRRHTGDFKKYLRTKSFDDFFDEIQFIIKVDVRVIS